MKSQAVKNFVSASGMQETSSFTIKTSSKAFKILSDGLYSNKIEAVVRELSCNAWDAHVVIGNTNTPFVIHLPNTFEPWFSIRDYGIGLSPENVQTLYTTYFESTKTESNDVIGTLGLGSKSPFAYTDQFTVNSYWNGQLSVWTAYISANGIPNISLVAQEETEESNGLEIHIPVQANDIRTFTEAVKAKCNRFPIRPKIVGLDIFKWNEEKEIILQGNGWRIVDTDFRRDYNPIAIQGYVEYPIKNNLIADKMSRLGKRLEVEFDIGELEVTPSRESLSYDARTIDNIDTKLTQVLNELKELINKYFRECETIWDVKVLMSGRSTLGATINNILHIFSMPVKWKGVNVTHENFILFVDNITAFNVDPLTLFTKFSRAKRGYQIIGKAFKTEKSYNAPKWSIEPTSTTVFLYDDEGKGAHTKIKTFLNNSDLKTQQQYFKINEK